MSQFDIMYAHQCRARCGGSGPTGHFAQCESPAHIHLPSAAIRFLSASPDRKVSGGQDLCRLIYNGQWAFHISWGGGRNISVAANYRIRGGFSEPVF